MFGNAILYFTFRGVRLLFTIVSAVFFFSFAGKAQTFLRLSHHGLFKDKTYEVFNYEVLEYRLKGEWKFKKNKIVNMRDSSVLFGDDSEIRLNQIAALRLRSNNFLATKFRKFFIRGGVLFFSLNTLNNLLIETRPVVTENSIYISAGLIGTGLLVREILIKRIRINSRNHLKVIENDFKHLDTSSAGAR